MADLEHGDYSEEEVASIYQLGKFFLENGDIKSAENVMRGLTVVKPLFYPAWLGLSYVALLDGGTDRALQCAEQAVAIAPEAIEALFYLITCALSVGDYNKAGTYLGEVAEKIENEQVSDPQLLRFYRAQLVRYENRG